MRSVEAIYRAGTLTLEHPLELRDGEIVRVVLLRRGDPDRWDTARLAATGTEDVALAESGLAEWADSLDAQDRR